MDENIEMNIPQERRIEIDNILRKTEEDLEQHKNKTMSYEEFKERFELSGIRRRFARVFERN